MWDALGWYFVLHAIGGANEDMLDAVFGIGGSIDLFVELCVHKEYSTTAHQQRQEDVIGWRVAFDQLSLIRPFARSERQCLLACPRVCVPCRMCGG
jgi:hypothetical protein